MAPQKYMILCVLGDGACICLGHNTLRFFRAAQLDNPFGLCPRCCYCCMVYAAAMNTP
jgi:hypothetical protein